MSFVLYALGVWLVASVPVAMAVGWMCKLNRLPEDAGEVSIAGAPDPAPEPRFVREPTQTLALL